ncbi:MAG: asparagine synthase (glutamine-hydrolyzing) [Candidatus Cloacimonetes bacterium]|nr:asparagine synthase (glutamine-hydrolyzing) [Candidatus Cloacimonadota bacterium]
MCGIVGVLALRNSLARFENLKKMVDKISHRGPDDAGYLFFQTNSKSNEKDSYFQNLTEDLFQQSYEDLRSIDSSSIQRDLNHREYDLYMGHRRLSILDTSKAGHQPMSDVSKNIWLTYNGEIYNFQELRSELECLGYVFSSNTDSEVIIYSYIEWGISCLSKFNGMFAFSLYDNRSKKLFLVRDRYGIKPLYYTLTKSRDLVYASEIKAILEYDKVNSEIDCEGLYEYFTFQNIFTDKTLNKDIQILEAGSYLELNLKTCSDDPDPLKKVTYWDFDFSESEIVRDEREYIEELERLFTQAVHRQLIADVPIGSYLSGGMDSGSITAIASKKIPWLKTFTIGFDLRSASGLELSFDEREKSEYLSYLFKTEHYEMVLKSGDMERCIEDFSYHLEEPRVGQSYPNFYAAKLASKFVKVVLSGAGGDELFAGYPWRYYRVANSNSFQDYIDKYYLFWQRLIPNKLMREVFSPVQNEVQDVWTRDIFAGVFNQKHSVVTPEQAINNSLYFEAKTFLHGLLLVEDKLSMAHSIETRLPFLDNDLVDFAQKIPISMKLNNLDSIIKLNENEVGKIQKSNDGKVILRKAMSGHIPDDVLQAIKQGFSSPDGSWFKGESIDFVKSKLLNKNSLIYRFMSYDTVVKLILEHLNGDQNRRLFIWSLLNFDQWCTLNLR